MRCGGGSRTDELLKDAPRGAAAQGDASQEDALGERRWRVRCGQRADLPLLQALIDEERLPGWKEHLQRIAGRGERVWVLDAPPLLASGFYVWRVLPPGRVAELDLLLVRRASRGRGLGSRLLAHWLQQAERMPSLAWLRLHVAVDNAAARRLYARAGFALHRRIENHYPPPCGSQRGSASLGNVSPGSASLGNASLKSVGARAAFQLQRPNCSDVAADRTRLHDVAALR